MIPIRLTTELFPECATCVFRNADAKDICEDCFEADLFEQDPECRVEHQPKVTA